MHVLFNESTTGFVLEVPKLPEVGYRISVVTSNFVSGMNLVDTTIEVTKRNPDFEGPRGQTAPHFQCK